MAMGSDPNGSLSNAETGVGWRCRDTGNHSPFSKVSSIKFPDALEKVSSILISPSD